MKEARLATETQDHRAFSCALAAGRGRPGSCKLADPAAQHLGRAPHGQHFLSLHSACAVVIATAWVCSCPLSLAALSCRPPPAPQLCAPYARCSAAGAEARKGAYIASPQAPDE